MTENVSTRPPIAKVSPPDASLAELMSRVSERSSTLIRDELRLARLAKSEKRKRAGLVAGLFCGAGPFARLRFPAWPARRHRGSQQAGGGVSQQGRGGVL